MSGAAWSGAAHRRRSPFATRVRTRALELSRGRGGGHARGSGEVVGRGGSPAHGSCMEGQEAVVAA